MLDRWQSGRLLLNLGFLVLAGALAGLGFGVGAVRVGGVGWCIRAALGLVCLARFGRSRSLGLGWPGLRSGWGDCGGLARFFCFAVGRTMVPLFGTPDVSTLFKV